MRCCHALGWKRDVKQGFVTRSHKVVQKRDVKRGALGHDARRAPLR